MKNSQKKIISSVLLLTVLMFSIPQQAQAKNLFRQFFRDLKRTTHFLVSLPDKITRPLGPVLGPIASAMLTQNISGHRKFGQLFNNVRRANRVIEDIEEQKRLTGEVRQMYRDQAGELRKYADQLREARENLRSQLTGRDVSVREYIDAAINIDKMIASVEASADRFENSANNLNTGDIIKMATGNLLQNVVGEIKNVALNELNEEILSVMHPGILNILSGQEGGGLDGLLDMLISGNLEAYDGKFDIDELRERIKDRINEILKDNKNNLQGNLRNEIDAIIKDIMNNVDSEMTETKNEADEAGNVKKEPEEPKNPYNDDELAAALTDIPKDEFGCLPGYEWQRMSGVGCVQKNCIAAGGHYSYTKTCICSFVDPKPGDKTRSCMRPSNYLACPSCVYACVTPDEECPAK